MKSLTKSCLLDSWPTFLVKECLHILLPSIIKLVNCSLSEGVVPANFKIFYSFGLVQVLSYSTDQKATLLPDDFKIYQSVSGLCFISKLDE